MDSSAIGSFLPLIVLFAIFYFLVIRPQQTQAKRHKQMLSSLDKGDKIITNGGLYAEVVKSEEEYLSIRLAEGVIVRLDRNFVAKKIEALPEDKAAKSPARKPRAKKSDAEVKKETKADAKAEAKTEAKTEAKADSAKDSAKIDESKEER